MQPVSTPRNSYPAFWRPAPFGRLPSPYRPNGRASLGQTTTFIDSPFVSVLVDAVAATASFLYGLSHRKPVEVGKRPPGALKPVGYAFIGIGVLAAIKGIIDISKLSR
jgi:hypothetical protein